MSAQDYYPFGMQMPERTFIAKNGYRYGLNGKEQDDEMNGEGNSYDFGARIYDPRVGIWLGVDPLQAKHPNESPYLFTGANPIYFVDPDGKDRIDHYKIITNRGTLQITIVTKNAFNAEAQPTYYGTRDLVKFNYDVYHTLDLRPGKSSAVSSYSEKTNYSSGKWDIGVMEYLQIKLTGRDDKLSIGGPQVVVYGSGTEDPGWGAKADPSKGIYSINYAELSDIIGDATTGMKDFTLKDPKDLVGKIPDLEYRIGKQVAKEIKKHQANTSEEPVNPAARTRVYVREDDFGTGPNREKKASIQDHAYVTDSVTRKKAGTNGSKVDTTYIRQRKKP
ncbi:MAG: hypothetical protein EOO15_01560 [Chitinophagaceae bacterium]|nr:MAG: hypothetical protein EOO15_01560 [Chitinophagaceae bacterium]